MSKAIKILDFDGTITDEIAEAKPFVEKFLELYSKESSIPLDDVHLLFDQTSPFITRYEDTGIDFGGKIVAPAISSQYLFYQVLAQKLYKASQNGAPYASEYKNQINLMDNKKIVEIYYPSYKASATVFRENAQEFLKKHNDAIIVTNSATDKVKSKLESIGINDIRLYGNAKKFNIAERIEGIPEKLEEMLDKDISRQIPRSIYLWRSDYKKVLDEICGKNKNVIVAGDVWEFDNVLPMALGYQTITLDNKTESNRIGMTQYERDVVPLLNNSHIANHLEDVDLLLDYYS
ncbi:MAG TPA: hypothetical protein VEC16_01695 [Alphaproteobacteria bacterium]|nr:hypothetical protein [Alphaproteobacteria bacterium]